jgi:hypothetical protein
MTLVETRVALHALAEHVLAPLRQRVEGRIGLQPVDGGFGTPLMPTPTGARQVCVRGTTLVDRTKEAERTEGLTTLGRAAAFVGLELGATAAPYPFTTTIDPDATLAVDPAQAREIADWFAFGDEALREVCTWHADRSPSEIQLWPEHFDLATTIDDVNLGASPGDAEHDDPYLYVGPSAPPSGPFWNEPFGASLTRSHVRDVASAVQFFARGLDLSR